MLSGMSTLLLSLLAAAAPQTEDLVLREVVAVERLGERRRSAVYTDGMEALLLVEPDPVFEEGASLTAADGEEHTWQRFEAGEDGWFGGAPFRGGWVFGTLTVPTSGPWRLDAAGHSRVLVDGQPRGGDVYALGLTRIPLALEAGTHRLLFRAGRGRLRASLQPAPAEAYLEEKDMTLPHVLRGAAGPFHSGVLVANAGKEPLVGWRVVARVEGGASRESAVPIVHGSSMRKCAVELPAPVSLSDDVDAVAYRLSLVDANGAERHSLERKLAVRRPDRTHVRTFVSEIDGSVQFFGVTPPREAPESPALFLSLHGAGVGADGQARCYSQKDWGYVVAPTNRRPFGFDWEDWGRLDALEVLRLAEGLFGTDARRTYLTGHSMGGHGTWQLGAHFPDRFAAIAPSAGWRDFWAYGGGGSFPDDDPVGAHLTRAANASRTLLLRRNYLQSGIYVLHGDADETVSVNEARAMREELAGFHPNFAYYEKAGAGHWWGNACMDWPPLFDFLKQNVLPDPTRVLEVELTTVNPAISSSCQWVVVEAQERPMEPSRVHARLDPKERVVTLELENVRRISLELEPLTRGDDGREPVFAAGTPLTVKIDEASIEAPFADAGTRVTLSSTDDGWAVGPTADRNAKSPVRSGPFKDAFRNRMVFVYATGGSPEENAWAFDKARYDHEVWRYRGNGAVDVVADTDFDPKAFPDRGVVLYGNRDTNRAWDGLLDSEAFDLRAGSVRVGDDELEGDELGVLAIRPRKDSTTAAVAIVGGTGLVGGRITTHLPYFVSGVGYPDWIVFGPEFLEVGLEGIHGSGWFDTDWGPGEGAWR